MPIEFYRLTYLLDGRVIYSGYYDDEEICKAVDKFLGFYDWYFDKRLIVAMDYLGFLQFRRDRYKCQDIIEHDNKTIYVDWYFSLTMMKHVRATIAILERELRRPFEIFQTFMIGKLPPDIMRLIFMYSIE